MKNLKIVSDGTATGTKVLVGEEELKGITKLEFLPLLPAENLQAVITVDVHKLTADIANYRFQPSHELGKAANQVVKKIAEELKDE